MKKTKVCSRMTRCAIAGGILLGLFARGPASAAQTERDAPLEGRGASIEFRGEGEADVFKTGAVLFTDRNYKVAECPAWLEGRRFLRNGINVDEFRVVEDGILTLLTPEPDHSRATTQVRALESMGFVWIRNPEKFQLFGTQPFDLTRIYQREMKAGQRVRLGKWTVLVGFESAERRDPVVVPWSENDGERLYNGIVLPGEWPPDTIDPQDTAPMPVPYLDHPPKIIPIDVGRQLFVDDFLVESTDLTRTYHMPRKYEGNPVLKPETELENPAPNNAAATPKSGGVWWDPAERVFKMWYEAGWIHTICYATSKDGLNWERPNLDVRPGTNQVLPLDLKPDSWTVVPDWTAEPEHRWTMRMQPPGKTQPGLCMTSPDGIHWSNRVWTGDAGDRSTHFYNPFRKKWVHSIRSGFRGRSRHYWESDAFLAERYWGPGEAVVWAAADRDDPPDPEIGDTAQLYNLDAVAYESIMLGMFEIHRGPANDKCSAMGLPKITELNFAYSRDGFHWHRPDRRAHIPAERRDVWDRGYVQPIGNVCTIQGDKLWIYYSAYRGDTNRVGGSWMQNGMYHRGATGVAFLRRDGFASMDAADAAVGTLTTRPVTFSGRSLFVNANTLRGSLRAEVRDPDGNPIPPFTLDNCAAFNGDSTIEPIRWKGEADLASLAGRPVRFHFELTGGSLYSFWVSRDDTGRSDGYVAGGGPGYTGPIDTVGRAVLK